MVTEAIVSVYAASGRDISCIENMMQFYSYDFSEWYPIALSEMGLFSLRPKEMYWAQPTVRPFLIYVNNNLAGFAVVDEQVVHKTTEFNLGYFFVARGYRGLGIGRKAAELLFYGFGGAWEVYHLVQNKAAGEFWLKVINALDAHGFEQSYEIIDSDPTRLLRFIVRQPSNFSFQGTLRETAA